MNMYTNYQYGGRSDDLEYMQEVLRTAERLGDQAYISRIRAQIEEIKRMQSGAKEDPRRKRGQVCKPGLPTMDPMSCRGDHMSKCVKDPKDNQFKCCSSKGGVLDCSEIPIPAKTSITPPPAEPKLIPTEPKLIPTESKAPISKLKSAVGKVIAVQSIQSSIQKTSQDMSDEEKRIVSDYFDLKMSILKNIEELRILKSKKDQLIKMTGRVPEMVFHNEQNNLDDCIRDESGKVLQC